jgi:chorismate mutase
MNATETDPNWSSPDSPLEIIPANRQRIDELDGEIIRLILERRELSRQIQAARLATGGVRVELNREAQILGTYRDALGQDGVTLASALLRACRGPLQ